MNSVANGKVTLRSPFREVYVPSAAGDAGGAIGAAFSVWHGLGGQRNFVMDHAYWGPAPGDREIRRLLEARAADVGAAACAIEYIADQGELCRRRPPR